MKNIESGEVLKDHINWVKFSGVTWHKNGFYYGRYPAPKENEKLTNANKNYKIYYHTLGTNQENDKLIYQDENHPERTFGISISEDEKYMFLYQQETTSGNGLFFKDLTNKKSKFLKLADGFDFEDRGAKLRHSIFNEKFTGKQGFPVDLNRAGSALGMLA